MNEVPFAKWEPYLRTLSVCSFLLLGWVAHRTLRVREDCITSTNVAYVRWSDGPRVVPLAENCRFSSRLQISFYKDALDLGQRRDLRQIESAANLTRGLEAPGPDLSVEIVPGRDYVLQRGALRIGRGWLDDLAQLSRALTMAQLRTQHWRSFGSQFQLEVAADLWNLVRGGPDHWPLGADDFSLKKDAKFPTVSPTFDAYCASPFRSLAHGHICEVRKKSPTSDSGDLFEKVWGLRAALVAGLYRAYTRLPLRQKLRVLTRFESGVAWPILSTLPRGEVAGLAEWFKTALSRNAEALGLSGRGDLPVRQALTELNVEAPTHWELTVDLTHTPAWREIVRQFKTWSQFRPKERTLLFTPEGQVALPSGLAVGWRPTEIESQKHILIACTWPKSMPADLNIHARQTFAQQSCEKLTEAFWD